VPGARTDQSLLLVLVVDVVVGALAGAGAAVEPESLEPDDDEDVEEAEPSLDEVPSVDAPLEAPDEAVLLDEESRESVR
jgi:hypothetical protein